MGFAGSKIPSGGAHKHPGEASGGMTNAKVSSAIPSGSVPSGEGQSSGVVNHKSMPSDQKVENLSNFPKSRK